MVEISTGPCVRVVVVRVIYHKLRFIVMFCSVQNLGLSLEKLLEICLKGARYSYRSVVLLSLSAR